MLGPQESPHPETPLGTAGIAYERLHAAGRPLERSLLFGSGVGLLGLSLFLAGVACSVGAAVDGLDMYFLAKRAGRVDFPMWRSV